MTKTDDIIAYIAFFSFAINVLMVLVAVVCAVFGFTSPWFMVASVGLFAVFLVMAILSEARQYTH